MRPIAQAGNQRVPSPSICFEDEQVQVVGGAIKAVGNDRIPADDQKRQPLGGGAFGDGRKDSHSSTKPRLRHAAKLKSGPPYFINSVSFGVIASAQIW